MVSNWEFFVALAERFHWCLQCVCTYRSGKASNNPKSTGRIDVLKIRCITFATYSHMVCGFMKLDIRHQGSYQAKRVPTAMIGHLFSAEWIVQPHLRSVQKLLWYLVALLCGGWTHGDFRLEKWHSPSAVFFFCAKLGRFLAICLSYITSVTGVVFLLDSFCASSARLSAPVDIEAGMGAFDISSPRSGYFVDVMTSTRYWFHKLGSPRFKRGETEKPFSTIWGFRVQQLQKHSNMHYVLTCVNMNLECLCWSCGYCRWPDGSGSQVGFQKDPDKQLGARLHCYMWINWTNMTCQLTSFCIAFTQFPGQKPYHNADLRTAAQLFRRMSSAYEAFKDGTAGHLFSK